MSKRRGTRVLAVVGSMVLITGVITGQASAGPPNPSKFTAAGLKPTATVEGAKSSSGQIAKSDPALLNRTDAARVNIMVKLDVDAAATYQGSISGFSATSPQVTGKTLNQADPAVATYLRYVDGQSAGAARQIVAAVPTAKVNRSFTVAYGGLSVSLPANRAKSLLAIPGVVAVQQDKPEHILSDPTVASTTISSDTTKFVGATKVWPALGGPKKAGAGVIVGVLDTGIWPEHPMLKDLGIPWPRPASKTFGCQFGDGTDAALGAPFTCNDKLVGAYAFTDTNLGVNGTVPGQYCDVSLKTAKHPNGQCSARDADGHGTHTTTTAAGSPVTSAPLLGVDRGPVSGIAPGASVIMYRVCLINGCYGSDSVAAVQQAILDGVNVLNFSIGGGAVAYNDPVELAFLDAYKAGISVSASAGNSGPANATAEHAGPWVTTVAASTSDRAFQSTLTLTSTDGATYSKVGSTITAGVTNKPIVLATDVPGYTGTAFCAAKFPAGSLTGKVVICERGGGGGGRIEKGYFASLAGAAGMILYNPTPADTETDNHFLPAIHLDGPNDAMLAFVAAHPGVTAGWGRGEKATVRGDVMTGFSSRGPDGDFIKPDITAPGVQVLAGNTPTPIEIPGGLPGQLYQAIAGTSMSSPHSAGMSALVKAAHKTWTPGQIKSALMTSSVQDVVNADGSPTTPWDRGAGSIRADRAISPTFTFDVTGAQYSASAATPMNRVDLNLPSINVNPLPGAVQTHRFAKNVSGKAQNFTVQVTSVPGLDITVTPSSGTISAGGTKNFTVLIDGTSVAAGWHFAQITIRPTDGTSTDAVMPVAVNRAAGSITIDQTCDPTSLLLKQQSNCSVTATNFAPVDADAKITVTKQTGLEVFGVQAPGHNNGRGAEWTGTLSAALAPTVDSITPGGSPAGYLPLADFGIDPIADAGDETQSVFDVPDFQYGSETYSKISVDSNGYVVIGGNGDSVDNECCNVQVFPNPERPNNVIAPFWTDLNPATGGSIRVGSLTDGATSYLVVDYAGVVAFGSDIANSFEVWIQLGSTEGIWMTYGTLGGANGQDLAIGAENRDGTSGVNLDSVASDSDYTVNTSPPTAGGSVTFKYKVASHTAGVYNLTASATSPLLLKGAAQDRDVITVNQ